MASKCSPPKSQSVRGYTRSGRRKKARGPASYWECYWRGSGCGTHHGSYTAALKHSSRLDRAERKQGRRADWTPRKFGP